MMNKSSTILVLLIFFLAVAFPAAPLMSKTNTAPIPATPNPNKPVYQFEYEFRGQTSGMLLLIFKYRFLFKSVASVLLNTEPLDEQTTGFSFKDIADTGYLMRSWGFTGKTMITIATDYDQEKVTGLLSNNRTLLREYSPSYEKVVKKWLTHRFSILTKAADAITFKRSITGIHKDCTINFPVKSLQDRGKYCIDFKIYPIMKELLTIYNEPFYGGPITRIPSLSLNQQWIGNNLDFSRTMNHIGRMITPLIGKEVIFKQSTPFRLTYGVTGKTINTLTITGTATPNISIYNKYKITQAKRTIIIQLPDCELIEDSYFFEIGQDQSKSGTVKCSLKKIEQY